MKHDAITNVRLGDGDDSIIIVDQTLLPNELKYLTLTERNEMLDAIRRLQVRGAPAIGIFAGYAMYVLARRFSYLPREGFFVKLNDIGTALTATRPTAVNLRYAVERMTRTAIKSAGSGVPAAIDALSRECRLIYDEDVDMCRRISENGLTLIKDGATVLTHCNAGPLATSRYGTALGPILLGKERGMDIHVFADETRPLLQGARLTAYELHEAGVNVTLICDNMAGMLMKQGKIDACFVGCDRVAANGDTANKIGTSSVAVLAKYYGVPFYVLGPTSTIDLSTPTGDAIVIEQRDPDEIKHMFYKKPMAPEGVNCFNPAFDVTDNSLITGIVTEKGIVRAPYAQELRKLFE